jgi:hypothetical protein
LSFILFVYFIFILSFFISALQHDRHVLLIYFTAFYVILQCSDVRINISAGGLLSGWRAEARVCVRV